MFEVIGCGIDVEDRGRFTKFISSENEIHGILKSIFTEKEIVNNYKIQPFFSFPLGFSCKEAVFKSFGISWTNSKIKWKDIELIFDDKDDLNIYHIKLSGYAAKIYKEMNCSELKSSYEFKDNLIIFEVIILAG